MLRTLLTRDIAKNERLAVAKALLASGDLSLEAKVSAVTAVPRQVANRAGREQLYQVDEIKGIRGEVILGLAVISTQGAQATLIDAVHERSRQLRARDPEAADSLDSILAILPNRERDAHLIAAVRDGTVSAPAVREAIRRRAWLCETETPALSALAEGRGDAAAVAVALLGSGERELQILTGEDRVAQTTLLALLRFTGDMVPDDVVLRLVDSQEPGLARAAQAYWKLLCRWHHTLSS